MECRPIARGAPAEGGLKIVATVRAQVFLFVILTSVSYFAHSESDPCDLAYWDGAKNAEAETCKSQAEAGGPNAEFKYALILWSGHDRPPDRRSALEWFRRSARQRHYLAQTVLGRLLSDAAVEPKLRNPVEAYAWWIAAGATKSAKQLLSTLNTSDASAAKALGSEYKTKYAKERPPSDGL